MIIDSTNNSHQNVDETSTEDNTNEEDNMQYTNDDVDHCAWHWLMLQTQREIKLRASLLKFTERMWNKWEIDIPIYMQCLWKHGL